VETDMHAPIARPIAAAFAFSAALLLHPATTWAQTDDDDGSHLTVTGVGEVDAAPDRVRILFAVETEGETAQEAGEKNATLMTAVTGAVRTAGEGVPGFRLETSGYALFPRYGPARANLPQEIVGYVARNTVEVTADDVTEAGALIDAALGAGANRVAGLNFVISDPEPFRHQAVTEAVTAARAEAEVMAAALGMRLGPPVDVQGGADTYYPVPMMDMAMRSGMEMAQAPPTPIEAGEQTITARVTIRFRLDPAP
jgi:uncharacterized protein YggE